MSETTARDRALRVALAVVAALAVGVAWWGQRPDTAPPAAGSRSQVIEVMESVTFRPVNSQLIAAKSMAPSTDQVLICDNYRGLAPMDMAETFVDFVVPDSGAVVVSLSAQTSNSEPDLFDYWGLMVGDEVVASGQVGRGEERKRTTARFLVGDLPAGEEIRMHWAHRSDPGGTANIYLGPEYGPAVMEVWSA